MVVLGLTGGIAAGKSTVSKIIQGMGIPIIDCDLIAREIVEPGSPVLDEIADRFGLDVLNNDGSLNRMRLSAKVFHDKTLLEVLNSIMHPPIKQIVLDRIEGYKRMSCKCCLVDAPLLIESDFTGIVDYVLLVYADEKVQIKRLIQRDGLTDEQAIERIMSQLSFERKKEYADYIIDNNLDEKYTTIQIEGIIKEIMFLEDNND